MNPRRRRLVRSWIALGIAAAAHEALAGSDDAGDDRAPQRPAASSAAAQARTAPGIDRTAGDYVEAFNAGPRAAAAFLAGRGGEPARTAALSERYAPLDVHAVAHTGERSIAFLARSLRTGEWVYLTLASGPGGLLDRVDPEVVTSRC